jgi:hypothetical protein
MCRIWSVGLAGFAPRRLKSPLPLSPPRERVRVRGISLIAKSSLALAI